MWEKSNMPPEITWSQVRRQWSLGFENILDYGVQRGWFNMLNPTDQSVQLISLSSNSRNPQTDIGVDDLVLPFALTDRV